MSDLRECPLGYLGIGDDPIDHPMKVRTMNALQRWGIDTVGRLVDAEDATFHHIPGIGATGRLEISLTRNILRKRLEELADARD